MTQRSQKIALLAFCALVLGGGIIFGNFLLSRPKDIPQIAGFVYPQPRTISPFRLVAHNGAPFDLSALKGKWSFVYFGYTYCPDVCPTTLVELGRAQKLLEQAGVDADNRYFLVSVDPNRDTPKQLGEYVAFFNKKLVGVTGTDEVLKTFTHEVGVLYEFPDGKIGNNYIVSHTSTLALFDPDARLHAIFTSPQKAEEIADGFRKIHERWSKRPRAEP